MAVSDLMKNIIILEDNADLADGLKEVIESILEQRAIITEDGSEVLALAAEQEFDLGLFDVNLPGMNGVAALKEIRRQGYSQPVIFMTGFRITQLVNEVFPSAPVYLISDSNIVNQIGLSLETPRSDAITLAYSTDFEDVEKAKLYCQDTLGYGCLDAKNYKVSGHVDANVNGYFFSDATVTDALAFTLFIREQGFSKPVILLGSYVDDANLGQPYGLFDVTGCVFKPFDLQSLLELMMAKLAEIKE